MINLLFLGASLAARVAGGVLVTILLAHALEPSAFGVIMLAFAVGGTVSLFADLGGSASALRSIGEAPDEAGRILSAALNAKLSVLLAALPLYAAGALYAYGFNAKAYSSILVFCAAAAASLNDLTIVAFRALGRNAGELLASVLSSVVTALIFALALFFRSDAIFVAALFLATRVLGLMFTRILCEWYAGVAITTRLYGVRDIVQYASHSRHWALSSMLSYLNGQIDNLLIGPVLGTTANGLYQSVARFSSIAMQVPAIAFNYWIPKIAKARKDGGDYRRLELQSSAALIAVGLLTGLGFAVLGPLFTSRLLPGAYADARMLWLPVAILAFCRFCSAASSVWLIGANRPADRAVGEAVALVLNVSGIVWLGPRFGLAVIPLVLAASALITCGISIALAIFPLGSKAPKPA